MEKRLVLFLLLLASLIVKLVHATELDTSLYPPEQLVWLRIHDYDATLPQSILTLHASLLKEEQKNCRGTYMDAAKQSLVAEYRALYRALADIENFAENGAFGDWSFILPVHELRDWYASVILHYQLNKALENIDTDTVASTLLHTLYEAYVIKTSGSNPPYIIVVDRKKLIELLKDLSDSYE